jgi:hypothetical protein
MVLGWMGDDDDDDNDDGGSIAVVCFPLLGILDGDFRSSS